LKLAPLKEKTPQTSLYGHSRQVNVHKILFINYIVAFFRFLVTLGMTSDIVEGGREKGGRSPPFSLPTIPI
jgi:hypothetical protein